MKISKLVISNSSRNMFRSCPRKLEFRKFYNSSRREESLATLAGSALHAAYQSFLVDKNWDNAALELMLGMKTDYDVEPLQARSLQACYATLVAMMQYDGYSHLELAYVNVNGERRPAIEVPFRIKVKNFSLSDDEHIPVEYIGYIDVIMHDVISKDFITTDVRSEERRVGKECRSRW